MSAEVSIDQILATQGISLLRVRWDSEDAIMPGSLLDYMQPMNSLAISEPAGQVLPSGVRLRSVRRHAGVGKVEADQVCECAHAVWQGPCDIVVDQVEILKACLAAKGGRQSARELVPTSLDDLGSCMAGSLI